MEQGVVSASRVRRSVGAAHWPIWAAWVTVLLTYAWLRVSLLEVPLDRDEGAFGFIGQAILRGELPYRDVLDHKPPGVFYLYALVLTVLPPTALGIHLFLSLWNLGTLFAVASVARRLCGETAAVAAAWCYAWVSASVSVRGFSGSSEMLMLLPMVLSVRLALVGRGGGRRRTLRIVLSGALGAAACWIKQPAALSLIVVPLWFASRHGWSRSRETVRYFSSWLAGGLGVSVVVCLVFVLQGEGAEFLYWSFTHSLLYAGSSGVRLASRVQSQLLDLLPDLVLWVVPAGVGAALAIRTRRSAAWFGPAFLVLSVLGAGHSFRLYAHYFAQFAPAIALTFGTGVVAVSGLLRQSSLAGRIRLTLVLLLIPALGTVAARPWYWIAPDPDEIVNRALGAQGFEVGAEVAGYLADHTNPDEPIFIYGSEPQIALQARRRLATPFVMLYPLTGPWPRAHEFQERAWAALLQSAPTYFLIVRNPRSLLNRADTDPFLSERVQDLSRRLYDTEALIVRDDDGKLRLLRVSPGFDAERFQQRTLFVIQRRRDRSHGRPEN